MLARLAAQRLVALNEELVRTSEQTHKAAEQLLAAKEVGRTDLIQARIETQSARLQLQTVENRAQAAWRQLATVVGVLIEVPVMLSVVRMVKRSREWYERGAVGR